MSIIILTIFLVPLKSQHESEIFVAEDVITEMLNATVDITQITTKHKKNWLQVINNEEKYFKIVKRKYEQFLQEHDYHKVGRAIGIMCAMKNNDKFKSDLIFELEESLKKKNRLSDFAINQLQLFILNSLQDEEKRMLDFCLEKIELCPDNPYPYFIYLKKTYNNSKNIKRNINEHLENIKYCENSKLKEWVIIHFK